MAPALSVLTVHSLAVAWRMVLSVSVASRSMAKLISVSSPASAWASDEGVVQVLIEMKAPGCQWLDLAEVA